MPLMHKSGEVDVGASHRFLHKIPVEGVRRQVHIVNEENPDQLRDRLRQTHLITTSVLHLDGLLPRLHFFLVLLLFIFFFFVWMLSNSITSARCQQSLTTVSVSPARPPSPAGGSPTGKPSNTHQAS